MKMDAFTNLVHQFSLISAKCLKKYWEIKIVIRYNKKIECEDEHLFHVEYIVLCRLSILLIV